MVPPPQPDAARPGAAVLVVTPGSLRTEAAWGAGFAAALAGYYYAPGFWVSLLPAAAFVALCYLRLDLGLMFALAVSPLWRFPKGFEPSEVPLVTDLFGRTETLRFSLFEFATLACMAAWLLIALRHGGATRRVAPRPRRAWLSPRLGPPLALLLAAAVSLAGSRELHLSLREFRVVVVEPLIFYFLLLQVVAHRDDVPRFLHAFLLLGAAMAVVALAHYFLVGIVESTGGVRRVLAIYWSPNALALFLERAVPVAAGLALLGGSLASGRRRWAYAGAAVLVSGAIFITYSRGAWLGLAAASVFLVLAFPPRRLAIVVVAGGLLAAVAMVAVLPGGRLLWGGSVEQRYHTWRSALHMIRDHPVLGVGLDNFLWYYRDGGYMVEEAAQEPNVALAHNLVLDFWTRTGILGLAASIWLLSAFWWAYARNRRRGDRTVAALATVLGGAMVTALVHGMLDNFFFLPDMAAGVWLLYGLQVVLLDEVQGTAEAA